MSYDSPNPATNITELDESLPAAGDSRTEGDDHIRSIKNAIKGSFPNFTGSSVTSTETELNYLDGPSPGTAVASKALVLNASKDADLDTGDLICTDATIENDVYLPNAPIIYIASGSSIYQHQIGASTTSISYRSGNYFSATDKYIRTGDGACKIGLSTGSQAGRVLIQTTGTGTVTNDITWDGPGFDCDADNTYPKMYSNGVGWEDIASRDYAVTIALAAIAGNKASVTTNGTAHTVIGTLSGAEDIVVHLDYLSTNTDNTSVLIQVGHNSGWVTTGYVGMTSGDGQGGKADTSLDTGFLMMPDAFQDTGIGLYGSITLRHFGSNLWLASGTAVLEDGQNATSTVIGKIDMSSNELTRVRVTTVGGTATFSSGVARAMAR